MEPLEFFESRDIKFYRKGGIKDKHLRDGWAQTTCPICGGDRLWLGYNIDKGYFSCYSHGKATKWDLFRAWFPTENVGNLLRSIQWAASIGTIPVEKESPNKFQMPDGVVPLLASMPHCVYVYSRHLDPIVVAENYAVGAITSGRLANRLFFPIHNLNYQPVTWQTRAIGESKVSYIAAKLTESAVPIKHMLFGEHLCSHYMTVIVVEGIFDALRINTATDTFGYCVATMGMNTTKEQVIKISEYPRRIICFDNEPEAQHRAYELARSLSCFPGRTEVVSLKSGKDPATASTAEIAQLLKYAGHL